jgi:oligopeptide transport system ATP-binding protein
VTEPLLTVRGLKTYYPIRSALLRRTIGEVRAVDGVDLDVMKGETLGVVGESGCGKSTLARTVMRLVAATAGEIGFDGKDVRHLRSAGLRAMRRDMQMIFQDPVGSLNPRMNVGEIVGEPLLIHRLGTKAERQRRVRDTLELVGLSSATVLDRYPHEFSGGQRQRIGIARALITEPKFLLADEPVSALDVSIQSQVLNLLVDVKNEFNLTYLFISHNLGAVGYISDRVAVMYLGRVVELGRVETLYEEPLHPYTIALLSAIPEPVPGRKSRRIVLKGDVPSPINPPSGCHFRTRCPLAKAICAEADPPLQRAPDGHWVACHFAGPTTAALRPELAAHS